MKFVHKIVYSYNEFYKQRGDDWRKLRKGDVEACYAGLHGPTVGLDQNHRFFQVSPPFDVTLGYEKREIAGIPGDADIFAWGYPAAVPLDREPPVGDEPEKQFMNNGGFLYFDPKGECIQATTIDVLPRVPQPGEEEQRIGIIFGRSQPLPTPILDFLRCEGRFQLVTIDALKKKGAIKFAWMRPHEFEDGNPVGKGWEAAPPGAVCCPDGAFVYQVQEEGEDIRAIYIPVADDMFARTMFEDEMEDFEAWVVIRPLRAVVEKHVIWDRKKSFEENMANHDDKEKIDISGRPILVSTENSLLNNERILYEEWQNRTEKGSIATPWIIEV